MAHRRLIEIAVPLEQVSLDSVHEKNVRHGHVSTLHIWPSRRRGSVRGGREPSESVCVGTAAAPSHFPMMRGLSRHCGTGEANVSAETPPTGGA